MSVSLVHRLPTARMVSSVFMPCTSLSPSSLLSLLELGLDPSPANSRRLRLRVFFEVANLPMHVFQVFPLPLMARLC